MLLTYFSLSFTLLLILSFYSFFIGFVDEYDTIQKVKNNAGIIEERSETFENMNNLSLSERRSRFSNEYKKREIKDNYTPPLNDNINFITPSRPQTPSKRFISEDPIKKDTQNRNIIKTRPTIPPKYSKSPALNPPTIIKVPSRKKPTPPTIPESKKIEIENAREKAEKEEEERKQIQSERNARQAINKANISRVAAQRKKIQLENMQKQLRRQEELKIQAERKAIMEKDADKRKAAEELAKKIKQEKMKNDTKEKLLIKQKDSADRIANIKEQEADILKQEADKRKKIVQQRKKRERKKRKEQRRKRKEKREKERRKRRIEWREATRKRQEQERKRKEAEEEAKRKEAEHQKAIREKEKAEKAKIKAQEEERMRKALEEKRKEEETIRLAKEAEEARIKAEREEMLKRIEEERIKKEKEAARIKAIREKNLEDAKRKIEEDAKKNSDLWDAFITKEEENERSIDKIINNYEAKQTINKNPVQLLPRTRNNLDGEEKTIEVSQDMMNCEKRIFSDTDPKGWTCAAPMPTNDLNYMYGANVKYHDSIEDIKAQKPDINIDLNKEYIIDDIGNKFEYLKANQQNNIKYDGIAKYKYGYENYIPKYEDSVIVSDLNETAKKEAQKNLEKLNDEYSFDKTIKISDNDKLINNYISQNRELILPKKTENINNYNSNKDSFNKNNIIWSLAQANI